jgi:hypothetical protein
METEFRWLDDVPTEECEETLVRLFEANLRHEGSAARRGGDYLQRQPAKERHGEPSLTMRQAQIR